MTLALGPGSRQSLERQQADLGRIVRKMLLKAGERLINVM